MKSKKLLSIVCIIVIPLIIIRTVQFARNRKSDDSEKDGLYLEPHFTGTSQLAYEVEWPKEAKQKDIDHIVKATEEEKAGETSYIDELSRIYVGEEDKEFFIKIIQNSEKVTYFSMNNAPGMLCEYMIYVGNIEFGYKSTINYEDSDNAYIFQLQSDDREKLEEWITGLRKTQQ